MKKIAQKVFALCTLLCVAGMHAARFYVISAATVPIYVGLFSVSGNNITDASKRPVYKLPKSGKNRTVKPYALFDFQGSTDQQFIFAINLEELELALADSQIPIDKPFSTLFTYQPQEPTTMFEIESERLTNQENSVQRLIIKPIEPTTRLIGAHAREEVNLSRRKAVERVKRLSAQSNQKPLAQEEPVVTIVEQRNVQQERLQLGDDEQDGSIMFHTAPKKTVTTLSDEPQEIQNRPRPARPHPVKSKSKWSLF